MENILVTGAAGFIGFSFIKKIAGRYNIIAVDSINNYYDTKLKLARLKELGFDSASFEYGRKYESSAAPLSFYKADVSDREAFPKIIESLNFSRIVHLAAQPGIRYSLENPRSYADSNLAGFLEILEAARAKNISHLVYASSSSVYGLNKKLPFSTSDNVDFPISLYAATKKSNELMAFTYSHLYGIPATGLRFFTVYGPWGRPDMAYFKFANKIQNGEEIEVYNRGKMKRDFTYIDDITSGISRALKSSPEPNEAAGGAKYKLYNIGNNKSVELEYFISLLEKELGKKAIKKYLPMQPGDVKETYADIDSFAADTGYEPKTPIEEGIKKFISWFKDYYGIDNA